VCEDELGNPQPISPASLADLFGLFTAHVECVVLNACYTEEQATAIARHVPYVVGMRKEMGAGASKQFAIGFYDAIGAGRSYEDAFELGRNAIALMGVPEHLTPILRRGFNGPQGGRMGRAENRSLAPLQQSLRGVPSHQRIEVTVTLKMQLDDASRLRALLASNPAERQEISRFLAETGEEACNRLLDSLASIKKPPIRANEDCVQLPHTHQGRVPPP
jgi:hypothetical protein